MNIYTVQLSIDGNERSYKDCTEYTYNTREEAEKMLSVLEQAAKSWNEKAAAQEQDCGDPDTERTTGINPINYLFRIVVRSGAAKAEPVGFVPENEYIETVDAQGNKVYKPKPRSVLEEMKRR